MLAFIDGDSFLSAAAWGRSREDAMAHVVRQISWVVSDTFCTDYLIGVGPDDQSNFRDKLHLEYKRSKSRMASKAKRPEWFGDLKKVLLEQPNVVQAVGCETDDLIRMWSCEARSAGDPFVVCSIDKDLDQIVGLHYNPKTKESYEVDEDYANSFYWQQVLQGDGVDNIPGVPGVGPVKAKSFLDGLESHEERRDVVIAIYKNVFGPEWRSNLLANARLIHMWRYEHDYFQLNDPFELDPAELNRRASRQSIF